MSLSFQLYSAREFQPWENVLQKLADTGYRYVEGFGGVYLAPDSMASRMRRMGLSMPTGHFALDDLENDFEGVRKTASALGISTLFCPYLTEPDRPKDAEGWRELAHRLAAIGEKATAAGFRFGWHNHDFEFVKLADGSVPMEIILTEAPGIEWEADVAWIARGGADPFDWIERHGHRITAVHVKDIAAEGECADEDGWADVGHGTLPWADLLKAVRAKADNPIMIVEHDNPSDGARFAERSYTSMKDFGEV